MEELVLQPPNTSAVEPTDADAAPADARSASDAGSEYVPATGFDRVTAEAKKDLEPVVYAKVTSDMTHVVWAYGIIFSIFAVYAVLLWRRTRRQAVDLAELRAAVDRLRGSQGSR